MSSLTSPGDPMNLLFSHQGRYRLPAETLRDNALFVSGLLELGEVGGGSIKPYQPEGYYRHLNFPTRKYSHTTGKGQYRRGVYMHWQRMFLHPMLKAMDAPSREECTAQRPKSNTPTAALVLLNDPTFVEAAMAFAERILREAPGGEAGRMQFAYRTALSRDPSPGELQTLSGLLVSAREYYSGNPAAPGQFIGKTNHTQAPGDLPPVELAAWAMVSRAILNLSETNTRN
jgi:hypothetical protein